MPDSDMRNLVVFRVPLKQWESGVLDSAALQDWLDQNCHENKPEVVLSDFDCQYRYLAVRFVTRAEACLLTAFLHERPGVEVAFSAR
jgi:hypothetical protein